MALTVGHKQFIAYCDLDTLNSGNVSILQLLDLYCYLNTVILKIFVEEGGRANAFISPQIMCFSNLDGQCLHKNCLELTSEVVEESTFDILYYPDFNYKS